MARAWRKGSYFWTPWGAVSGFAVSPFGTAPLDLDVLLLSAEKGLLVISHHVMGSSKQKGGEHGGRASVQQSDNDIFGVFGFSFGKAASRSWILESFPTFSVCSLLYLAFNMQLWLSLESR